MLDKYKFIIICLILLIIIILYKENNLYNNIKENLAQKAPWNLSRPNIPIPNSDNNYEWNNYN